MWDRLLGGWLLLDSLISILYYLKKPGETWKTNHSIRLIRAGIACYYLWKGWKGR